MRYSNVTFCIALLLNLCISDGKIGGFGLLSESYKPSFDKSTMDSSFQAKLPLPLNDLQYHGTTTLSFKHEDSIIVCVDSKASVGEYVGSRTVRKVFPVSKSIVATMAGGAADCAFWIRYISRVAKINEYRYDINLNAKAIARLLSAELKKQKRKVSSKEGQDDGECKSFGRPILALKRVNSFFHFGSWLLIGLSVGTMVAGWAKAEGPSCK